MKGFEHRVPPPIVLAVFAVGTVLAARQWPGAAMRFPGQGFLAVSLAVAGLAVVAAGIIEFRRARTTVNPLKPHEASALVDRGIFGRTRNPMYLGMALGLAGLGVWLGHAAGPLMLAGFVSYITRFQIMPEERALRANFGVAFDVYAARVRRWL